MTTPQVVMAVGSGPAFGSGHMMRMRALGGLLDERGVASRLVPYAGHADCSRPEFRTADVLVLDARDVDPETLDLGAKAKSCRIIALDNRCTSRFRAQAPRGDEAAPVFLDTIPHPEESLADVLPNVLLAPDLCATIAASRRPGLLTYSPTDHRAASIRTRFSRAGWRGPILSISQERPVSRQRFLAELARARLFVTHFGMSMLEAWWLGIPVALVSIGSPVHETLSYYMERAVGFPFLDDGALHRPTLVGAAIRRGLRFVPAARPGRLGFARLVECIERQLR